MAVGWFMRLSRDQEVVSSIPSAADYFSTWSCFLILLGVTKNWTEKIVHENFYILKKFGISSLLNTFKLSAPNVQYWQLRILL